MEPQEPEVKPHITTLNKLWDAAVESQQKPEGVIPWEEFRKAWEQLADSQNATKENIEHAGRMMILDPARARAALQAYMQSLRNPPLYQQTVCTYQQQQRHELSQAQAEA